MFWKSKKTKEKELDIRASISKASIGLERGSEEIEIFIDYFVNNNNDELRQKFENALSWSDKLRTVFDSDGVVTPELLLEVQSLYQFLLDAEREHSVLSGVDYGEGPWGFSMAHDNMSSLVRLRSKT